jgi:hypothetical protein
MSGSINWVPLFALGVVPILVLAALLPRMLRQRPPADRDAAAAASPLRRAQAAAEALTPAERARFLRWLDGRWPAPPADGRFTPPRPSDPDERITP